MASAGALQRKERAAGKSSHRAFLPGFDVLADAFVKEA
jgi:hypothetical protein